MRRLTAIVLSILAVSVGLYVSINQISKSQGITSGNTLNLYNWGDYIDPKLIT